MDAKKTKLYPAVKYAKWIRTLAKNHGVKSSEIVWRIVREGMRHHVYTAEEIRAAGRAPEMSSEVHFMADPRFVSDWESFKTRMSKVSGEEVGDTQAGRLLIARAWKWDAEKKAPNTQGTFDF